MKYTIIASALALASAAIASDPSSNKDSQVNKHEAQQGGSTSYRSDQCLSEEEAQQWLKSFIGVLGQTDPNRNQTADEIIADQFVEYSNSILSLSGRALNGQPAAASKEAWTQGVLNAPAAQGIETRDVVVGCNKIVWHWSFQKVGAGIYQSNGFNLFTMTRKGTQLQASRLDLEFDSIAWGLNTGFGVTYRNGTQAKGSGESGQRSEGSQNGGH